MAASSLPPRYVAGRPRASTALAHSRAAVQILALAVVFAALLLTKMGQSKSRRVSPEPRDLKSRPGMEAAQDGKNVDGIALTPAPDRTAASPTYDLARPGPTPTPPRSTTSGKPVYDLATPGPAQSKGGEAGAAPTRRSVGVIPQPVYEMAKPASDPSPRDPFSDTQKSNVKAVPQESEHGDGSLPRSSARRSESRPAYQPKASSSDPFDHPDDDVE